MKLVKSHNKRTDILDDQLTRTQIQILKLFVEENRITEIATLLGVSVNEIECLISTLKLSWGFKGEVGLTFQIIRRGYYDDSGIMRYANLAQCLEKLEISVGLRNSLKKFLSTVDQKTFTAGELTLDHFLQIGGAGFKRYGEYLGALRNLSIEINEPGIIGSKEVG